VISMKASIRFRWLIAGLVLTAVHVALSVMSPKSEHGRGILSMTILGFVALMLTAGAAYLAEIWHMNAVGEGLFLWILGVGLLMRASIFFSTPIPEDDCYCYLLDGGVAAARYSGPYSAQHWWGCRVLL
jgi:hypothetical protein